MGKVGYALFRGVYFINGFDYFVYSSLFDWQTAILIFMGLLGIEGLFVGTVFEIIFMCIYGFSEFRIGFLLIPLVSILIAGKPKVFDKRDTFAKFYIAGIIAYMVFLIFCTWHTFSIAGIAGMEYIPPFLKKFIFSDIIHLIIIIPIAMKLRPIIARFLSQDGKYLQSENIMSNNNNVFVSSQIGGQTVEINQKAGFYVNANREFFPSDKILVIKNKLEGLADDQLVFVNSIVKLKNPKILLIVSIFLGYFGIDRFMLGNIGLAIGKLVFPIFIALTYTSASYTSSFEYKIYGFSNSPIIFMFIVYAIWLIVDIFLIQNSAKQKNYEKFMNALSVSDTK
jgi:hypothetical protein